jgi:chondroitin AC lyase
MEEPYNEEGLMMHHVADGANFLSRTGKEYIDVFPVWDWQKIPGTTVVQKPSLPPANQIAKKGLSDFVGAVSDGEFGAAAFDFKSVHDRLTARKSWFFFDREYVCLGTAITSEADYPVATTLNQCLSGNNVLVKTKNGLQTLNKGVHNLKEVSWVMHDSVAYLFPSSVNVNISNATAAGNWRQINHQASASTELVQKELFTIWLDHGKKPRSASYAYLVVPAIASSLIDEYSKKHNLIMLANTPEVQAVHNKSLNISEVVFYQAGTIKLSGNISLTAKNPCIVIMRIAGNALQRMAVSAPTQKLKSLQFQITTPLNASGNNWRSVWNKESKSSAIDIDLPQDGNAGKSVIIEIRGKKG